MIETLFILLVVYQLKHFLADYPLQGAYMLGKFKDGWDFLGPLLAHVAVHGLFTFFICLIVRPELWWLSVVDMVIHFTMDRLKAGKKYLGRFKALSGNEFVQLMPLLQDVERWQGAGGFRFPEPHQVALEKVRSNTYFWWSLGLDQMVHHLTHYYIIWKLVTG